MVFLQPDATHVPRETELLDKVTTWFHGVAQLLDWCELPNNFLLVMECPEQSQDLFDFLPAWGLRVRGGGAGAVPPIAEAVQHCSSCWVLHWDIKPDNILHGLATGQAKLMDLPVAPTSKTHSAHALQVSPPRAMLPVGPGISWPHLAVAPGIPPFAASQGHTYETQRSACTRQKERSAESFHLLSLLNPSVSSS